MAIRPGPEARRGAACGTLAAAAACVVIAGLYLRTGFGYAFDFVFAIFFAAVLIPLVAVVVALLLTIAGTLPRLATGWIIASCVIVMLEWFPPHVGIPAAIVVGLTEGLLGATIATFAVGRFAQAALSKRILTVLLFLIAVTANTFIFWFLGRDGSMEKLVSWRPSADTMPATLSMPDPSRDGPHSVKRLFYGAGTDIRRPEYGSSVRIKTHTVDASAFVKDVKGWRHWTRTTYWGFDADELPLNARVWYPDGPGPFPLALIVHGNHNMAEFSDPGYAYLGELLASRGFIVASVDENFLNDSLFDDALEPESVRGWLLLEHLKLWREWNQTPGNPFHHKVDLSHIALMGHSRGGEAAATAAAFNRMTFYPDDANIRFDYRFPITAVVAIAPADGQYKPAGQHRWIEDVSYLTLQGAHDTDVSSFRGSRQWDHVRYTQPGPWFKAEVYAYRANHGQFNTVWGRTDTERPLSWLLNLKPLMPGEEQRRIAKIYIAAFLEATLRERREYLPLFQDWRVARQWLPDTLYVNRYQDASYMPLASFDEDADVTTTTAAGGHMAGENLSIWREGRIPWRQGDRDYNGVFLGWNRTPGAPAPTYAITLPEGAAAKWRLGSRSTIELSIAALDQDAPLPGNRKDKSKTRDRESPDFTLELVASDGAIASAPVSRFAAIPPPLKVKLTKLDVLDRKAYEKDWEPVFQTVRVPLMALQSAGGSVRFDVRKLNMVRLKFDRTARAVICVSGIGFGEQ
ncbi:MAG TPA: MFS transporter [Candidatus Nitrosotalea sp.]|nr:MFS transporter [Candidatus Nitrosotalea sp.]